MVGKAMNYKHHSPAVGWIPKFACMCVCMCVGRRRGEACVKRGEGYT